MGGFMAGSTAMASLKFLEITSTNSVELSILLTFSNFVFGETVQSGRKTAAIS